MMEKSVIFSLVLWLALGGLALGQEGQEEVTPDLLIEEWEGALLDEPVNIGNKLCPISGEKVGEMGEIITQEYNGKIINFCCKMCLKDFKKDPEMYMMKVEAMMKAEAEAAEEEAAQKEGTEEEGEEITSEKVGVEEEEIHGEEETAIEEESGEEVSHEHNHSDHEHQREHD